MSMVRDKTHQVDRGLRIAKTYSDPIWGKIELTSLAVDIINTIEFQRTDGIKQLGFVEYVNRGAKHTRFQHMIGVYHVVKRILGQVWENHVRFALEPPCNDKKRFNVLREIVGVAGLLHDLSHVPFGHTLEDEMKGLYLKHDDLKNPRLWYQLYGTSQRGESSLRLAGVFEKEEDYFSSLSNEDLRDLVYLIIVHDQGIDKDGNLTTFNKRIDEALDDVTSSEFESRWRKSGYRTEDMKIMLSHVKEIHEKMREKAYFEPWMSDVVSDTICADLIDYLARDGESTRGRIYFPDIEDHFVIKKCSLSGDRHLAIKMYTDEELKLGISTNILALMRNRYDMAEGVYYDNTKMSADIMLGKLLTLVGPPPDVPPTYALAENGMKSNSSFHWHEAGNSILAMTDESLFEYCHWRVQELQRNGSEKDAQKAIDLLRLFKSRSFFRPCLIVPQYLGTTTSLTEPPEREWKTLFDFLMSVFRRKEHGEEMSQQIEEALNSIFEDDRIHVLAFCPPFKDKAKELGTFVEITLDEVKPLHVLSHQEHRHLPQPRRKDILNLNELYKELWKFYLLIHPEDSDNEITKYAVRLKFWSVLATLGIKPESLTSSSYPLSFELPHVLLEKWMENNAAFCSELKDRPIYSRLDSMASGFARIKKWDEIIDKLMEMRKVTASLDDAWKMIFEEELRAYYNDNVPEYAIKEVEPLEVWERITEARSGKSSPDTLVELAHRESPGDVHEARIPYFDELNRHGLIERIQD